MSCGFAFKQVLESVSRVLWAITATSHLPLPTLEPVLNQLSQFRGINKDHSPIVCHGRLVPIFYTYGNMVLTGHATGREGLGMSRWDGLRCHWIGVGTQTLEGLSPSCLPLPHPHTPNTAHSRRTQRIAPWSQQDFPDLIRGNNTKSQSPCLTEPILLSGLDLRFMIVCRGRGHPVELGPKLLLEKQPLCLGEAVSNLPF